MDITVLMCLCIEFATWKYNTYGFKTIDKENIFYKFPDSTPLYFAWSLMMIKNHPIYNIGSLMGLEPSWWRYLTPHSKQFKIHKFDQLNAINMEPICLQMFHICILNGTRFFVKILLVASKFPLLDYMEYMCCPMDRNMVS